MSDDVIDMGDVMAIYEVTDRFEIDRETISVPLEKSGEGSVTASDDGSIEITAPVRVPIQEWLPALQAAVEALGFSMEDAADLWD